MLGHGLTFLLLYFYVYIMLWAIFKMVLEQKCDMWGGGLKREKIIE